MITARRAGTLTPLWYEIASLSLRSGQAPSLAMTRRVLKKIPRVIASPHLGRSDLGPQGSDPLSRTEADRYAEPCDPSSEGNSADVIQIRDRFAEPRDDEKGG